MLKQVATVRTAMNRELITVTNQCSVNKISVSIK